MAIKGEKAQTNEISNMHANAKILANKYGVSFTQKTSTQLSGQNLKDSDINTLISLLKTCNTVRRHNKNINNTIITNMQNINKDDIITPSMLNTITGYVDNLANTNYCACDYNCRCDSHCTCNGDCSCDGGNCCDSDCCNSDCNCNSDGCGYNCECDTVGEYGGSETCMDCQCDSDCPCDSDCDCDANCCDNDCCDSDCCDSDFLNY
jgi:hypothetical protein